MSAAQSPNTPFRKSVLNGGGAQQKVSQEPPGPFNASQASQFESGSQSPYRGPPSEVDNDENNHGPERYGQDVDLLLEAGEEVQIPATNPADRGSTQTLLPQTVSQSPSKVISSERDASPAEASDKNGVNLELEEFDMDGFHSRYHAELSAIVKDESTLIADFDKFSEAIAMWAHSASQRDTDRASKRLKTRERYVELAEDALEAKKAHYLQVVQAFKNALTLLSQ